MAGPWFTVQKIGDSWQTLSSVWISNGQQDIKGRIDMRIQLTSSDEQGKTH